MTLQTAPGGRALILPTAFVVLESTGYIGGTFGVRYAEPFTMTACRFCLAALIFLQLALVMRSVWPRSPISYFHASVTGVLMQAMQFGGLYTGIKQGVPAGEAALIFGLLPIFIVMAASIWLHERLSWRDIPGSLLGIGGVAIVIFSRVGHAHAHLSAYVAVGLGLTGITAGTIYQKKYMGDIDLWVGCFLQMVVSSIIMLILALQTETMHISNPVPFAAAVIWVTVMCSFGALSLMYVLLKRGKASKATNLFHLTPAVTQIMASLLLGEIPSMTALVGFAVSGSGVYLMNQNHRL